MAGIDWQIAEHKIPIYLGVKLVNQRLRRMQPEWALKINKEVQKQLDVGFI